MIPRDHQRRRHLLQAAHEAMRRLELAVPGPLRQVTRNHHRIGLQLGSEILDCFQLGQLRVPAEMHIRDVQDVDAHQRAHTR